MAAAEVSGVFLEALGGARRRFLDAKTIFSDFDLILERFLGGAKCYQKPIRAARTICKIFGVDFQYIFE